MLYVTLSNDTVRQWHIGERFPLTYKEIFMVTEIQADCDELEDITQRFVNLPMCTTLRVHRWFGDYARLIAACIIDRQRR